MENHDSSCSLLFKVLLGVALPIVVFIVVVVVINILQEKKPNVLPAKLRSWEDLGVPEALRSLAPYDRVFTRMRAACPCGKKNDKTAPEQEMEPVKVGMGDTPLSDSQTVTLKGGKGAVTQRLENGVRNQVAPLADKDCGNGHVENGRSVTKL
jgi:hypothetical protein